MRSPSKRDLLFMSLALHGSSPDTVAGDALITSNGLTVIAQVLEWLDLWDDSLVEAGEGCAFDPAVHELYFILVRESLPSEPQLVRGFGNLTTMAPRFVAFGLTDIGRTRAARLFKLHPEYGNPGNDDQSR